MNAAFWRGECWLPANDLVRWLMRLPGGHVWQLHGDAGAWWVLDQLLVIAGYMYQQDRSHGARVKLAHPLSPEQFRDVVAVLTSG